MKQIIFFTPQFLPHLGGVETHISQISRVLADRGWKVVIVTLQHDESQLLEVKNKYSTVVRIPLTAQVNKFSLWNWIKNYFKNVPVQSIIHIHDVGWWLIFQLLFGRKNNFYITFHGWEGVYPVRWQAKLHRLIIAWLVKGSIHVGKFIQMYYWDKPTAIVYGGVTLPVQSVISEPNKDTFHLVFLGRLEKENDIELYLQVLTELATSDIRVDVTWVGDGSYRRICQKWGKVTGMVTDTKKYIQPANFVFASSYLSILESQAQGKIVCSMYSNKLKKDYVTTFPAAELLLVSDDPKKIASKIKELAADIDMFRRLSKKNAVFGQAQTWNRVADTYEELWGTK